MRCHICDSPLTTTEINDDPHVRGGYRECGVCFRAGGHNLNTNDDELTDYEALLKEVFIDAKI